MKNSILLHKVTPQQLADLIDERTQKSLDDFKKELLNKEANDELLTREQTCKYLQIDSSTLWHWTNKSKVKAYGIGNRRYYKRSELFSESLKLLKK